MKYFICSKCGKKKQTRPQRYKKILIEKYNNNRDLLKKNYICRNCKYKIAKRLIVNKYDLQKKNEELSISQTQQYKELLILLHNRTKLLYENGIQYRECREAYYYDVKKILSQYNVVDFIINIMDNKIHSITIKKVPFIGSYDISIGEINEK